ncbi:MAG: translation initiation factor IF-2 [Ignavibacteriales bacterium]|nr:translation initiation factor IF-2 [Ignavibacteriales bacterium]
MSEKTKIRLYKFASEYNLSSEQLIEFLKDKGHKIKGLMSMLSDEMLADIRAKYKKEIEKAEKHYKKINEFHKKISPDKEVETPEEIIEEGVEEKTEINEEEISTEKIVKEELVEDVEILEKEEKATEEVTQKDENKKADVFKTPTEKELEKKKEGLKIIGKIDLEKKKETKNKDYEKGREKPQEQRQKPDAQKIEKEETGEKKQIGKLGPEVKFKEYLDEERDQLKPKRKKKKKKGKQAGEEGESADKFIRSKKKKKSVAVVIDAEEVDAAIRRTLISMEETTLGVRANVRKRKRKEKQEQEERIQEQKILEQNIIKVNEFISVGELANLMDVDTNEIIKKCIGLGLMVSINQRLDVETITLIADEFGFQVEFQEEYIADSLEDTEDSTEELLPRPPVVTIMGHVDHGKTTLLDYIRRTNVVAGEYGGITQHIGAYQVQVKDNKFITFLDTPGHEAFTAMRARGASVTDIVVLVVAADDAVMPQTIEAINHAQAAQVPIIIAINKIDKPGANPEKIRQQLSERNILVEDWGGKYQCVELAAKSGLNVEELLEKILLEAEMLDLKANPNREARGAVIETKLEHGRGVTSTILIEKGTLRIGDPFVAGSTYGRVRAMFDERGNKIDEAPPATPVVVLGFESSPQAGDTFVVVESEREAREVGIKRQQLDREQHHRQVRHITLDEISEQIKTGIVKELALIVKGDVDGSVEALADSFMKLTNDKVAVNVIHKGVGSITEGDVLLASASDAIIIGFHVRPNINARKLAEKEKIDIKLYNIIYDAIATVKAALEGMLAPIISEELMGTIEVRDIFKVPKVGTVAGCYVLEGKIIRQNKIRIFRDEVRIWEGELASLKRFKDDVREVDGGYECGLSVYNFNDIKVGDIIESYKLVETKQKLS